MSEPLAGPRLTAVRTRPSEPVVRTVAGPQDDPYADRPSAARVDLPPPQVTPAQLCVAVGIGLQLQHQGTTLHHLGLDLPADLATNPQARVKLRREIWRIRDEVGRIAAELDNV